MISVFFQVLRSGQAPQAAQRAPGGQQRQVGRRRIRVQRGRPRQVRQRHALQLPAQGR